MSTFGARIAVIGAAFMIFAAFAVHGPFGARRIEKELERAAASLLSDAGLNWATARAQGRTVLIGGEAPDAAARDSIAAALEKKIAGLGGIDFSGVVVAMPAGFEEDARRTTADGSAPPPRIATIAPAPADSRPNAAPVPPLSAADCQSAINRALNGRRLTYAPNSARLSAADRVLLSSFIEAIADCDGRTIVVEGHTDSTGAPAANLTLSEQRAEAVIDYFETLEVNADFRMRAYGETRPIASNSSAAGRRSNRRIDFVAVGDSQSE